MKDEYFIPALRRVAESQKCSTTDLMKTFYIGYNRAARLVQTMEDMNYVSTPKDAQPRQVFITLDEFLDLYEGK